MTLTRSASKGRNLLSGRKGGIGCGWYFSSICVEGSGCTAELVAFEGDVEGGQLLGEVGFGGLEGSADLGLEAFVELVVAVGALKLGEELSEAVGDGTGAEVDGALAATAAVGEAEVGAEASSSADSPGGDDGALGGEEAGVGEDEGSGAIVASFLAVWQLVNRVASFHGWGLW